MMKLPGGIAMVVLAASLAACGGPDSNPIATPSPTPTISDLLTPSPTSEPSYEVVGTIPEDLDAAIRSELNARGIAGAEAELVEARKVTWNNGALGCPEPGMSYTQALTPGWQIIVSVAGVSYDFRFGTDSTAKLCETPGLAPTTKSSDL